MEPTWTGGTIAGAIIAIVGVAFAIGILIAGLHYDERFIAWVGAVVAIAVLGTYVLAMWPFEAAYHKWQPVVGELASIDKRLLSDGQGGMSEAFPVTIKGRDDVYRVDDTRAATWKPGTHVKLRCKRDYSFSGYDGWTCIIGGK